MLKNDRCKKTIPLTLAVILILAAVTGFSAIAEKYGKTAYGLSSAASYHFTGKPKHTAGELTEADTYISKKKRRTTGSRGKKARGLLCRMGRLLWIHA